MGLWSVSWALCCIHQGVNGVSCFSWGSPLATSVEVCSHNLWSWLHPQHSISALAVYSLYANRLSTNSSVEHVRSHRCLRNMGGYPRLTYLTFSLLIHPFAFTTYIQVLAKSRIPKICLGISHVTLKPMKNKLLLDLPQKISGCV